MQLLMSNLSPEQIQYL